LGSVTVNSKEPSEIEESTCEKEGELKIKLGKERMQGTKRKMENYKNY
jgi:hypothetical protein